MGLFLEVYMKEINKMLTHINYKPLASRQIRFIIIHYTANNGDTAKGNCNYFLKRYRGASAHYFVDENSIWQCVEDKDVAWHIGARKYYTDARNENSIGVELCSRKDDSGVYYFKDEVVKNAQELVRYLAKKYDVTENRILRHFDCTKKICPAPFVNNIQAWEDFKKGLELDNEMGYKIYNTLIEVPDWARPSCEKAIIANVLRGTGSGLGLNDTELKMIVWLDRCGCFDEK